MSKGIITTKGPDEGKIIYRANRHQGSGNGMHCYRDDHDLWREILQARDNAAEKHGVNSIEEIPADMIVNWLTILLEEFGEVGACLTYDKTSGNGWAEDRKALRRELIDIASVTTAWITRIDIDN